IPLFFLVVNIGQVSKTFPSSTPFLKGQGYVAFQLPVSLMFAVATATSGLALVTEIDLGYFDKLLVAPIRRSSIIFGRLTADLAAASEAPRWCSCSASPSARISRAAWPEPLWS